MPYECCVAGTRYASTCTDVLSNTAQVLTSLVEALTEDRDSDVSKEESLSLLEEAIELFQRCLTLQEYQFAESQAREEGAAAAEPQPLETIQSPDPTSTISPTPAPSSYGPLSSSTSGSSSTRTTAQTAPEQPSTSTSQEQEGQEEERWATILEPITNDTLLDTCLAQLETLTLLCTLLSSPPRSQDSRPLTWIEEYSSSLLQTKIPAYVSGTDRDEEAALTRANFLAALADANFRAQRMDAETYARALEDAFGALDLTGDAEGLSDKAEALLAFCSSIRAFDSSGSAMAEVCWKAYTTALDALTTASKIPAAENVAKIHLLRGDVELLRYQLGLESGYAVAVMNAATLLKNAGTYYRGAEAVGRASGGEGEEEVGEAVVKVALAGALAGEGAGSQGMGVQGEGGGRLQELMKTEPEATQRVLEEAVEEGLVGIEWLVRSGVVRG
jgi:hypothetical protein